MDKETMTGRTSHRAHKPLFGSIKLILMVEVEKETWPDAYQGSKVELLWRDARASDLLIKP